MLLATWCKESVRYLLRRRPFFISARRTGEGVCVLCLLCSIVFLGWFPAEVPSLIRGEKKQPLNIPFLLRILKQSQGENLLCLVIRPLAATSQGWNRKAEHNLKNTKYFSVVIFPKQIYLGTYIADVLLLMEFYLTGMCCGKSSNTSPDLRRSCS